MTGEQSLDGKVYTGARVGAEKPPNIVLEVVQDGIAHSLPSRLDLREHSVNLEWGYGIGGPAQLALAILADATGNDAYAVRHYQWFKIDIISRLPWDGWELTERQIWDWIAEHHPLEKG